MSLSMMLFAVTLACAPVDAKATTPSPRVLNPTNHVQHHREIVAKKGASKQTECNALDQYEEWVYFSDATHSSVIGWRIYWCDGTTHHYGRTSGFCDWYIECCETYASDIGTCETGWPAP